MILITGNRNFTATSASCWMQSVFSSGARSFHLGPDGLGDGSPQWVQGRSPGRGSEGRSRRRRWSSLQTLLTDFDCRNDQKLNISNTEFTSWFQASLFHSGGPSDSLRGLSPLAHAWHQMVCVVWVLWTALCHSLIFVRVLLNLNTTCRTNVKRGELCTSSDAVNEVGRHDEVCTGVIWLQAV